jgi:hypothetical protein
MDKPAKQQDDWELREAILKGDGGRVLPAVRRTLCLPSESPQSPDSTDSSKAVPSAPWSPAEPVSDQARLRA